MQFVLISITAALGGLLFGYDTGVISSALLFVRSVFHLSTAGQSLVAGIVLVGAVLGAIVAGSLSDRFGRRPVILVTALAFVIGALLSAAAGSVAMLLAGRLLIGIAIGVASMLTPLYLAEIAPAASRGAVTSLNQLCITLGILVSYLVGYAFADACRRAGAGCWAWARCRVRSWPLECWCCRKVRAGWRGTTAWPRPRRCCADCVRSPAEVADELATLRTDLLREGGRLVPWSALLAPRLRPALIVGVGLAMFQQITGINTVIYFAPQIFQAAGLSSASVSILATAGVGAVNVALTLVSMWLIDRRRAAGAAVVEPGRHGGDPADPGRRLCARHLGGVGLDHRAVGRGLRGVLRGRTGAGVLAADRRDLPARGARPRHEPRDHLQLGLQPAGDGHLPGPHRAVRPYRHVPALCRADAGRGRPSRPSWCRRRRDAAWRKSRTRWRAGISQRPSP